MIDFDQILQEELEALEQDHIVDDTPAQPEQPEQPQEPEQAEQETEQAQEQPSEEELMSRQIDANQDVFTKIYLLKRLDKLSRWMVNLKSVVNRHVDADAIKQFESYQMLLGVLKQVALATETAVLYHTLIQLEIELLELLRKLDAVDEKISEDLNDGENTSTDVHE